MKIQDLVKSPNICDLLDDDEVQRIGLSCKQGYDEDKSSRSEWESWNAEALKLALQVREKKTFPWAGAANVKFPLMTIAALNWHAKAYPATISADSVVKCRVVGEDKDGSKTARAVRVGKHMSYQLLEKSNWEEQTDKGLLVLAILGTMFKKTLRDNNLKMNCSDMVMPQDLVVNYFTQDMETAERVTHCFQMSKNQIHENNMGGFYRPAKMPDQPVIGPLQAAKDRAQHTQPPQNTEIFFLGEQSCWLDLDEDGYKEPYAVTFDLASGYVYRIIARYFESDVEYVETGKNKGKIKRINPENYYTKFGFIPSPDGGFYDLGLGVLLGPINESVNSAINQIFDAGTLKTLGGGFLGRGIRMKGGETSFKPAEWKPVDSTGDNLRNNIVPLPVSEISPILLDLVKFLVNYGERVAGAGDIQVGELPGQNVKAETMAIANENGRLIFNATYKRFWRSLKEEFKKIYRLNQVFPPDGQFSDKNGIAYVIGPDDYKQSDEGIVPAADPNVTSNAERRQMWDMVLATAQAQPGFNTYLINKERLEAYNIPNIDNIYPDPKGENAIPAGPNPQMMELEIKAKREELRAMEIQNNHQQAVGKLLVQAQLVQAQIEELRAKAAMEMKKAQGVDIGHVIALLDLQIAEKNQQHKTILDTIDMLHTVLGGKSGDGRPISKSGSLERAVPQLEALAGNPDVLQIPQQSEGVGEGRLGV